MESRQTANKNIAAAHVDAKVANIRKCPDIRPNDGKRFFGPIKSAVACVDLKERSALRGVPSLVGLKKRPAVPRIRRYADCARPARSRGNNPRTRRNVVVCVAKDQPIMDVARDLSKNPASRGLRDW